MRITTAPEILIWFRRAETAAALSPWLENLPNPYFCRTCAELLQRLKQPGPCRLVLLETAGDLSTTAALIKAIRTVRPQVSIHELDQPARKQVHNLCLTLDQQHLYHALPEHCPS